jgi:hypothetical protein
VLRDRLMQAGWTKTSIFSGGRAGSNHAVLATRGWFALALRIAFRHPATARIEQRDAHAQPVRRVNQRRVNDANVAQT